MRQGMRQRMRKLERAKDRAGAESSSHTIGDAWHCAAQLDWTRLGGLAQLSSTERKSGARAGSRSGLWVVLYDPGVGQDIRKGQALVRVLPQQLRV